MFGFLKRLRKKDDRQLFRFHDGQKWRSVDPIVASRRLESDSEYNSERTPRELKVGDVNAMDVVIRSMGRVFGVQPYDETTGIGMTQSETMALYVSFVNYIETLKKNIWRGSTSAELSASTSSPSKHATTNGTAPSTSPATASS